MATFPFLLGLRRSPVSLLSLCKVGESVGCGVELLEERGCRERANGSREGGVRGG
jgi:hypothetical protein